MANCKKFYYPKEENGANEGEVKKEKPKLVKRRHGKKIRP